MQTALLLMIVASGIGAVPLHASAQRFPVDECRDAFTAMLQEERTAYRAVQFGADHRSVLGTKNAKTTDLIPYLIENYRGFSCRLESVCNAVAASHGHLSQEALPLIQRPIGCTRLYSASGRWWDPDRRNLTFRTEPIAACAYSAENEDVRASFLVDPKNECNEFVDQILTEERQMLRLLVAEDSAERGSRKVVGTFQIVLQDVRDSFLEPLRGMADLFGSVLHPIPCLLTQCN